MLDLLASKNIILVIFSVTFLYFLWKNLLVYYPPHKLFDLFFMFILHGVFFDRIIFVITHFTEISVATWTISRSGVDSLPWVIINLNSFGAFSFVNILFGGLLGLFLYNGANLIKKVRFNQLDRILRIFLISLIPILIISLLQILRNEGFSRETLNSLVPVIIRALMIITLLGLYNFKKVFWESKHGIISALILLVFSLVEILVNYISEGFGPVILGLFSVVQIVSIVTIIIAFNIFFSSISELQDEIIKRKLPQNEPLPARGFAISFANKRRVSNPLNIRLKNLRKFSSNRKTDNRT